MGYSTITAEKQNIFFKVLERKKTQDNNVCGNKCNNDLGKTFPSTTEVDNSYVLVV